MSLGDWIRGLHCSQLAKVALEAQFANTNGAPTSQQSYLANFALVKGAAAHGDPDDFFTMSENVKCAQGNDALAFALEADIRKPWRQGPPVDAGREDQRSKKTMSSSRRPTASRSPPLS